MRLILSAVAALAALLVPKATAEVHVVATTPDLAWFASQIGGDATKVESLTKGRENLHSFTVKPRTLVAVAKCDLLLENGLSLESTWLPDLVISSRNDKLTSEAGGRVNCSVGVTPIQVPDSLSREEGDVHPQGNPHMSLSPLVGRTIAGNVHEALVRADPDNKAGYDRRHDELCARIAKAEQRWACYQPLFEGQQAIVYHKEFDYLVEYLGMRQLISIEPKPGLPPTPAHLAEVIQVARDHHVPAILVAPWSNNRQAKSITAKTDCALLELPALVGGADYATGWIELIDGTLERMRKAYGLPEPDFSSLDVGGEDKNG